MSGEDHERRTPHWKRLIGWAAMLVLAGGVISVLIISVGTALVGWPWSEPEVRAAFQGIFLFAGAFLSVVLLIFASVAWGPLSPEADHD